jgi:hypothetical protein
MDLHEIIAKVVELGLFSELQRGGKSVEDVWR